MSESVRVAVRVRPLLANEKSENCVSIVEYPNENQVTIKSHEFTYDYVHAEQHTQETVYLDCVCPLVRAFLDGYNATVLAYGQTGSGKTFTMGTADMDQQDPELMGIIPRVTQEIFTTIQERRQHTDFQVKATFLEVHNEVLHDLLNPSPYESQALAIRDDAGYVYVSGLLEQPLSTYDQLLQTLATGSARRATGETKMNQVSSRSHAVFTVLLSQTRKKAAVDDPDKEPKDDLDDIDEVLLSKFHFVDLAGSERLKRTQATGKRRQEGVNINLGLLALGNVISILGDPARKSGHVPFRDSLVTRLLKDSLGGNSQTLMIACVSPAHTNEEESLNTLRYANRARNIKNKPMINRDPQSEKMARLKARILELETLCLENGINIHVQNPARPNTAAPPVAEAKTQASFNRPQTAAADLLSPRPEAMNAFIYESEIQKLTAKLGQMRLESSATKDQLIAAETQLEAVRSQLARVAASGVRIEGFAISGEEIASVEQQKIKINSLEMKLKKKKADIIQLKTMLEYQITRAPQAMAILNSADEGEDVEEALTKLKTAGVSDLTGESATEPPKTETITGDSSDEDSEDDSKNQLEKAQDREYQRLYNSDMQELSKKHRDLDTSITEKGLIMKELVKQREHNFYMQRQYETKITSMEKEINKINAEKEASVKNLQDEGQIKQIRDQNEKKISELKKQIASFRSKLLENQRMKQALVQDELKITELESEITSAKKKRVQLQKRMQEKAEAHREWIKEKRKQELQMQKENRRTTLALRNLKQRFLTQQAVLERRIQEKKLLSQQVQTMKAQKVDRDNSNSKKSVAKSKFSSVVIRNQPRKPEEFEEVGFDTLRTNSDRIVEAALRAVSFIQLSEEKVKEKENRTYEAMLLKRKMLDVLPQKTREYYEQRRNKVLAQANRCDEEVQQAQSDFEQCGIPVRPKNDGYGSFALDFKAVEDFPLGSAEDTRALMLHLLEQIMNYKIEHAQKASLQEARSQDLRGSEERWARPVSQNFPESNLQRQVSRQYSRSSAVSPTPPAPQPSPRGADRRAEQNLSSGPAQPSPAAQAPVVKSSQLQFQQQLRENFVSFMDNFGLPALASKDGADLPAPSHIRGGGHAVNSLTVDTTFRDLSDPDSVDDFGLTLSAQGDRTDSAREAELRRSRGVVPPKGASQALKVAARGKSAGGTNLTRQAQEVTERLYTIKREPVYDPKEPKIGAREQRAAVERLSSSHTGISRHLHLEVASKRERERQQVQQESGNSASEGEPLTTSRVDGRPTTSPAVRPEHVTEYTKEPDVYQRLTNYKFYPTTARERQSQTNSKSKRPGGSDSKPTTPNPPPDKAEDVLSSKRRQGVKQNGQKKTPAVTNRDHEPEDPELETLILHTDEPTSPPVANVVIQKARGVSATPVAAGRGLQVSDLMDDDGFPGDEIRAQSADENSERDMTD